MTLVEFLGYVDLSIERAKRLAVSGPLLFPGEVPMVIYLIAAAAVVVVCVGGGGGGGGSGGGGDDGVAFPSTMLWGTPAVCGCRLANARPRQV